MGRGDWIQLGLSREIADVAIAQGFQEPMAVQKATIPLFISNKDVLVEAVTGSGKTLSFLLPILKLILDERKAGGDVSCPHSLVIAPTRDLAMQIYTVSKSLLRSFGLRTCLILGGDKTCEQNIKNFLGKAKKPANVVVSTPGRFAELLEINEKDMFSFKGYFRNLQMLILDEADRLLDMGFHERLTSILQNLPKQRRTGLFSATQTESLDDIIRAGLRNPVRVTVHSKTPTLPNGEPITDDAMIKTPAKLRNCYVSCTGENKLDMLLTFLNENMESKILLFLSTSCQVNYFRTFLPKFLPSLNLLMIHGKMKKKRNQVVEKFRKMKQGILLSTDLLSRGIDIENIDWVLQYDPPSCATSFVHRCGRTARADKSGSALIFLMPNEIDYAGFIEISLKAPLQEYEIQVPEKFSQSVEKLKTLAQEDRTVLELGTRAFVSYVQAYKKHECSYIFNMKNLNFGEVANGFGLLRLPRMPELGKRDISAFKRTEIDTASIAYTDTAKEAERIARLGTVRKTESKSSIKMVRKARIEKKKLKRKQIRKGKNEFTSDELEEIRRDSSLLKKSKKKQLGDEELLERLQCDIV